MKQSVYYQGLCGKKWGIWDVQQNQWQFDICEDTAHVGDSTPVPKNWTQRPQRTPL